ncbi:hypothetical protein L2E20_23825, partial [Salmonella enterica subsp. enterica serovar Weltevreden]|uniref:hypothetical protein n=1 Tax=Salmonella enterica TaxID=28901 RepID=UPI001F256C57
AVLINLPSLGLGEGGVFFGKRKKETQNKVLFLLKAKKKKPYFYLREKPKKNQKIKNLKPPHPEKFNPHPPWKHFNQNKKLK